MMCFVSCNLDPNTLNTLICVWTQASYKVGAKAEDRAFPEHLSLHKLSVSLFTQFTRVQNDNIYGIFGAGRKTAMISDNSVLYCSRNNSCDIISELRPGQRRYHVSLPGKGNFFVLQRFQTALGSTQLPSSRRVKLTGYLQLVFSFT